MLIIVQGAKQRRDTVLDKFARTVITFERGHGEHVCHPARDPQFNRPGRVNNSVRIQIAESAIYAARACKVDNRVKFFIETDHEIGVGPGHFHCGSSSSRVRLTIGYDGAGVHRPRP